MTLAVFLEPAVQHIGVHAVLQGDRGNRGAGLLASRHQFGLELWGVGAVRTPHRIAGCLRDFEHHVHGRLRAHDLPQADQVIQDGLATRLRPGRVRIFV